MNADEIVLEARRAIIALKCPGYYRTNYHCRDCRDEVRQYCGAANKTDIANIMVELIAKTESLQAQLAASQSRERAAVEDMPHYCGMCANHCTEEEATQKCGEGWEGEGCDDWQWRGPQEAGKGGAE